MAEQVQVCVLLSGGIDSAALVHYYVNRGKSVLGLHFMYNDVSRAREVDACRFISGAYNISLRVEELTTGLSSWHGEYYARNALFVLAAVGILGDTSPIVAIGIHRGEPSYYDCSERFVVDVQTIIDGYFRGAVQVDAPLLPLDSHDVIAYCRRERIPIEHTYSCERNPFRPCGECASCCTRSYHGIL